ncbi:MAG: ankyrin repeat domain-containing protein [Saprospiraceae bacterium]|nr:ankyrin repeat domain-containing protein [Saprospiraceae bacterium]
MKILGIVLSLLFCAGLQAQQNLQTVIDQKNYSAAKNLSSSTEVNQLIEVEGVKMTALSYASLKADIEMVNLLIQKGALVSPITDTRDALMFAAKGGNREIVELLLSKGANVMNESKEGKTARDYADAAGHQEIAVILQTEMYKIIQQAKARRIKK